MSKGWGPNTIIKHARNAILTPIPQMEPHIDDMMA